MKPIYKIIIISVLIVALVIGAYIAWKKITAPLQEEPSEEAGAIDKINLPGGGKTGATTGGQTEPSTGKTEKELTFRKISELPVFDFWTVSGNSEIYYLTEDGKIYNAKQGPDGDVSKQIINALNFIQVAPGEEKILAAFGDPRAPKWGIFDVFDKVWRPLPSDILNATWADTSDRLIAIVKQNQEFSLADVDLKKNPPQYKTLIHDFRLKDVDLAFRSPNDLFLVEKPANDYDGRVWKLDLKNLTLNTLLQKEEGLWVSWSTDRRFFFHSSANQNFYIFDQALQRTIPTFISSLPPKCAYVASTTYCFVPENIPDNVQMPDDYLMNKFYSVDNLFVINHDTSETKQIWSSNTLDIPAIDGKHPRYLNGSLYFINRYDNYLYELGLGK